MKMEERWPVSETDLQHAAGRTNHAGALHKQAATLRREQNGLLGKIQGIQKAALAPVDDAIDMARLMSRAIELSPSIT